jgi:hypothetical protein
MAIEAIVAGNQITSLALFFAAARRNRRWLLSLAMDT